MGCIRVDKITEYLCEPLRKCLKDEDPYVRKTAAVCVAKLHDINSQLVEDQGFLDSLKDLLSDSNPMVGLSQCSGQLTCTEAYQLTLVSLVKLRSKEAELFIAIVVWSYEWYKCKLQ